jgi:hypothetical protein
MAERKRSFVFRRDWWLALAAILAAAFVLAGIAYEYTGDMTGFATLGTGSKGTDQADRGGR